MQCRSIHLFHLDSRTSSGLLGFNSAQACFKACSPFTGSTWTMDCGGSTQSVELAIEEAMALRQDQFHEAKSCSGGQKWAAAACQNTKGRRAADSRHTSDFSFHETALGARRDKDRSGIFLRVQLRRQRKGAGVLKSECQNVLRCVSAKMQVTPW